MTRQTQTQIDTNVYWAAAVVDHAPFAWYFAPYYAFGIAALSAHLAVARHRKPEGRIYTLLVLSTGTILGVAIVAGLMAVDIPARYEVRFAL